jgi:hypothetical protein
MAFLDRTGAAGALLWMFRWPEALDAERHLRRAAGRARSPRLVFTDLLPLQLRIQGVCPAPSRARLSFSARLSGERAGAAGKGVADLFLDSPEYNAHGTATEGRGGAAVRRRGGAAPGAELPQRPHGAVGS